MDNLIEEFLNSDITITKFALSHGIKVSDFSDALRARGHYVYRNATLNVIKYMHLAIKDYLSGEYSLASLEKKYGISAKTISDQLKKQNVDIINHQNEIRFDDSIFKTINTKEKAYWLGFIFADGYIESEHNGKQQYGFELTLAAHDVEHLRKFNKFMKHREDNVKFKKDTNAYRWGVRNKQLWTSLNEKGCTPRKSLTLKFPDKSIFTNKVFIKDFIRGYFDGDGCITFADYKGYCSCRMKLLGTKEFLEAVQKYSNCSGKMKLDNRHGNAYELVFNKDESMNFADYIYKNSTIHLDRKFNRYQNFKKWNNAVPKSDLEDY